MATDGDERARAPLAGVDEVRDELRRLGYLQSGLDRFVLAGAAAASPARASWRAAWRVGLVGGPLVGVVLGLGAAAVDARLLGQAQDLVVLAVYLSVAAGLAVALLAFAAGLTASALARRGATAPPALSRNVGLGLGVLALGYLALWWRSHLPAHRPALIALALVLGVALAAALGRFGSLAAVAVLSAAAGPSRLPEASLSRRRLLPLLATAAVLLGAAVAAGSWLAGRPAPPPDYAVVPTGLRVRLVAVDGLDPKLARQMADEGAMPHLSALLARAARYALRLEPEQVPAIVWTTVATGRGPQAHGIHSAGTRRLPGMRTSVALDEEGTFGRALARAGETLRLTRVQPATSVLRDVKTLWNVASEKGLRVGVVNWWATWPADAVNGYVVSERAFFKLEKGGELEREVHPPEAFARLRALAAAGRADERARALDAFHARAAALLRQPSPPDLEALYLPGLDIATMQRLGQGGGADLAALDARLAALREHYRFLDTLLGELAFGEDEVVVLVADPGRLPRATGAAAEGLLALAGGVARPGDRGTASQRDVCPTVLHLAGLPASRELEGRVLDEALEPGFAARHPVRWVARYGRRPSARPAESRFDREMVEELKSLGYIQ
jgi:hypothetical protein